MRNDNTGRNILNDILDPRYRDSLPALVIPTQERTRVRPVAGSWRFDAYRQQSVWTVGHDTMGFVKEELILSDPLWVADNHPEALEAWFDYWVAKDHRDRLFSLYTDSRKLRESLQKNTKK